MFCFSEIKIFCGPPPLNNFAHTRGRGDIHSDLKYRSLIGPLPTIYSRPLSLPGGRLRGLILPRRRTAASAPAPYLEIGWEVWSFPGGRQQPLHQLLTWRLAKRFDPSQVEDSSLCTSSLPGGWLKGLIPPRWRTAASAPAPPYLEVGWEVWSLPGGGQQPLYQLRLLAPHSILLSLLLLGGSIQAVKSFI